MDNASTNGDQPTLKQLAYLRSLAEQTGQTFAHPRTRSQASREIRRLTNGQTSSRVERSIERKDVADAIEHRPEDATRTAE
jgi:hypothetical protein